jgi:hypothetical protein
LNVRENRAGCDHIHGGVLNAVEPLSGTLKKRALTQHISLSCQRLCVPKQRRRDVSEQHLQRGANAVNGTKCDFTITGANVCQRHSGGQPSGIENTIGVPINLRTNPLLVRGVPATTIVQQPLGPHIGWLVSRFDAHAFDVLPVVLRTSVERRIGKNLELGVADLAVA